MNGLTLRIAWSMTMARWKQALVAAIGITFGIGAFVTLLTFMTGLNDLLDKMILDRTPHVRLFNDYKSRDDQPINHAPAFQGQHNFIARNAAKDERIEIHDALEIRKALLRDRRVVGVAPKISTQVFFLDGANERAAVINGIDVASEARLFHFDDYVIRGKSSSIENIPNTIILGAELANDLGVTLNDRVYITTSRGQHFSLKVAGIFQSGIQEYDKVQCYASITTVQNIAGKSRQYITDLHIKLTTLEGADKVAKEFAQRFNTDSEDIKSSNAQFETGSSVRTTISYAVGVTLLIVAGFGIFNILNMMIFEKIDAIAILKATGFTNHDVNTIFTSISMGIGLFGGVMGIVMGYFGSIAIDHIPFETKTLPTIRTYPVSYDPLLYIIGFVFSLVTTYFAGLAPALKASRVDPVAIIRGK